MSEPTEAVARALFDAWNAGESSSDVYARLMSPDFVCHGPPGINHSHESGAENCLFFILKECFEDLAFELTDMSVDGDRAIAHFGVRGRQIAPFRGVAPRGEERVFEGLTILRVEGGKIVEGWGSMNW